MIKSIKFTNEDILNVIDSLTKLADVDYVVSPEVAAKITATLTDIPVSEGLSNILQAHGYGFIATENMIRVVPRSQIIDIKEKMVNRVYRITYADVREVEKALKKFISKQGSLSSMPGTSNIIVTDTESKIKAIDSFIEEIDRVTQQVLVEVRIYDVTDTDSFDLDIEWTAQRNVVDSTSPAVIYPTTPQNLFPTLQAGATSETVLLPLKNADPYGGGSFDETNGGSLRIGFFNDSVSFDLLLSALKKTEYATLLANPSIMVLDNETAKFEIIKEIPYKEETSTGSGGQLTSTEFKDVGVKLEVTPHITRDEMLRLHIMTEFGIAEAQLRNPSTNEPIVPTVNTRRLDTIALLKSGSTVVLGGLRKQEVSKNLFKTPIFGDLPLVGGLFCSENESTETTELLVFITPIIVDDAPAMDSSQIETYKYTDIPSVGYPPLKSDD